MVTAMKRVSILGSGIGGMVVGAGLSKLGNSVIFRDIDKKKVPSLAEAGFATTSKLGEAIDESARDYSHE